MREEEEASVLMVGGKKHSGDQSNENGIEGLELLHKTNGRTKKRIANKELDLIVSRLSGSSLWTTAEHQLKGSLEVVVDKEDK